MLGRRVRGADKPARLHRLSGDVIIESGPVDLSAGLRSSAKFTVTGKTHPLKASLFAK